MVAITYYLAHRAVLDEYLQQAEVEYQVLHQVTHQADPVFSKKLNKVRRQMQIAIQ